MRHTIQARQFRARIESAVQLLPDDVAGEYSDLFPQWAPGWIEQHGPIYQGQRFRDGDNLFRSIHPLTADAQNTRPSETPSMWTRIANPAEEWPYWIRPIGAHDAYPAGAQVTHNGRRWVSDSDGNVWEPGVAMWTLADG